jgi:hypothetical protein
MMLFRRFLRQKRDEKIRDALSSGHSEITRLPSGTLTHREVFVGPETDG